MTASPALAESQLTDTVLLVRPAHFGYNPDTARTNAFQQLAAEAEAAGIAARAQAEFDELVARLRAADVRVLVFDDPGTPPTPDSLFPNNWVSFHPGGRVVLYPMEAPSRRPERRAAVLALVRAHGLPTGEVLDLTGLEAQQQFLEGTGSLVLDRAARVAYAARSPRTHPAAVAAWAAAMGYEPVVFDAADAAGRPIYHTNVLLSVGESVALACFDALPDPAQAAALRTRLAAGGRTVVSISHEQLNGFAGNALQVRTRAGTPLLVLSAGGWHCLTAPQRAAIEARTSVLTAPLPTIERYGGGSARCMLAEVVGLPHPAAG